MPGRFLPRGALLSPGGFIPGSWNVSADSGQSLRTLGLCRDIAVCDKTLDENAATRVVLEIQVADAQEHFVACADEG